MNRKSNYFINNWIKIGLLFNGIFLVANRFSLLPEFFLCLTQGFGLAFILIGFIRGDRDMSKVKEFKRNLYKKIVSR